MLPIPLSPPHPPLKMRTLFTERGWFSRPNARPASLRGQKTWAHTGKVCGGEDSSHRGRNSGEVHTGTKYQMYAFAGKLRPSGKFTAQELRGTSLRSVWLQLAQQQWQNHFLLMNTERDGSQLEAKRNKKCSWRVFRPLSAVSVFPPHACHLPCNTSTRKQRRRTTRRINAQRELSERIWGCGVSVRRRGRSNTACGT